MLPPPPTVCRTFRRDHSAGRSMMTRVHDDSTLVLARVARFVRERLTPALYRRAATADRSGLVAPGEPVPFAEAARPGVHPVRDRVGRGGGRGARCGSTSPAAVPADWTDPATRPELVVDLGFTAGLPGFQAEGLAYARGRDGAHRHRAAAPPRPAAGRRRARRWSSTSRRRRTRTWAADWEFRPTPLGDPATAGSAPLYRLGGDRRRAARRARLGAPAGLLDAERAGRASCRPTCRGAPSCVRALERAVDVVDPDDVSGTAERGPGRAGARCWPARPTPSAHRVHAVGHAHIDSAWLWPVRETVRKVARTFANVVALQEQGEPGWSSRRPRRSSTRGWPEHHPALFERVRAQVAAGRFVPVGGMWVESDTNMPGGEALARQFVAGKRFFIDELGVEPLEVWLPDSFGYSAALPQIIAAAGSPLVPHPEDLLERDERDAAPHVRLGGHRRDADLHPLPAGRHLQRRAVRRGAGPGAAPVRREGPGEHLAGAVRMGRRRRRADPGDAGRGRPDPVAGGLADRAGSPRPRSSSPPPRRSTRSRRCGPGSCTWSSTAAPTPRRPGPSGATGAASTCCARPSCGRPRPRCAPAPRTRTRCCSGAGERCCCSSSTTSCPAPRSRGCTSRPSASTRGSAAELEGVIGEALGALDRAG